MMKTSMEVIGTALVVASCGEVEYTQRKPVPQISTLRNCTVVEDVMRITVLCPDGSSAVIDWQDGQDGATGADGKDGSDGKDGENGSPGADGEDGGQGEPGQTGGQGADGNDGQDGQDGKDGAAGSDGAAGADGKDGTSCTVREVKDGGLIECPDGTSVLIRHGKPKGKK